MTHKTCLCTVQTALALHSSPLLHVCCHVIVHSLTAHALSSVGANLTDQNCCIGCKSPLRLAMFVTNVAKHVGHLQIERLCTCHLSPSTVIVVTQVCILSIVTSALLRGLCPCAMLILQPVCLLKGITAQVCSCTNL